MYPQPALRPLWLALRPLQLSLNTLWLALSPSSWPSDPYSWPSEPSSWPLDPFDRLADRLTDVHLFVDRSVNASAINVVSHKSRRKDYEYKYYYIGNPQ